MDNNTQIDPKHEEKRKALRIIGFICLIPGIILIVAGFVGFFSGVSSMFNAVGTPGMDIGTRPGGSNTFFLIFLGMPLMFAGLICLRLGFQGAVARYVSGEISPVAKDTVNYVADGVEDEVEDLARHVAKGISSTGGIKEKILVLCPKCKTKNDEDAKFCKSCGYSFK